MLIPLPLLQDASDQAHAALGQYLNGAGPRFMLLSEDAAGLNPTWAAWFAYFAGGASTQRFARLLPAGYGSWLLRLPAAAGPVRPTIAINSSQIRRWASLGVASPRFREEILTSRCVYHEVGHIRLHGYLMGPAPGMGAPALAPYSTPQDEEQAWVFTFIVLGMIVGDYAEFCRGHGRDDSPTKMV